MDMHIPGKPLNVGPDMRTSKALNLKLGHVAQLAKSAIRHKLHTASGEHQQLTNRKSLSHRNRVLASRQRAAQRTQNLMWGFCTDNGKSPRTHTSTPITGTRTSTAISAKLEATHVKQLHSKQASALHCTSFRTVPSKAKRIRQLGKATRHQGSKPKALLLRLHNDRLPLLWHITDPFA